MSRLMVALIGVGMGVLAGNAGAHAPGEADLTGRAHVDLVHARAIALRHRPGTVVAQELEEETGGSGLRYSFSILAGARSFALSVDAVSGKVLENRAESVSEG